MAKKVRPFALGMQVGGGRKKLHIKWIFYPKYYPILK